MVTYLTNVCIDTSFMVHVEDHNPRALLVKQMTATPMNASRRRGPFLNSFLLLPLMSMGVFSDG